MGPCRHNSRRVLSSSYQLCVFLGGEGFLFHTLSLSIIDSLVFFPIKLLNLSCFLRHGSIPEALRAANVSQQMKSLLRFLQTVQGTVPCTDAARRVMRGKISSLTTYFGNPLLFVTLNPADVLHPFTWRRSLDAPALPLPTATLDQYLVSALEDYRL